MRLFSVSALIVSLGVACSTGEHPAETHTLTAYIPPLTASSQPPTQIPSPALSSATPKPTPIPTFAPIRVILPAGPVPTRPPTPEPEIALEVKFEAIGLQVSSMRGLSAKHPIRKKILTKNQMASYLGRIFEEDGGRFSGSERLFVTLGIIPPSTNLMEIYLRLYSESILGVYDPKEETIFLGVLNPQKDFGPSQERIFAHEFVHGLQQQHFDIRGITERLRESGNADAMRAFQALREGDAYLSEAMYTNKFMEPHERASSENELNSNFLQQFRAAPHLIKREYVFPFQQGLKFVMDLFRTGGWDAVDKAFQNLPVSSEQVMHLDKYMSRDAPIKVAMINPIPKLGSGWRLIEKGVLGEFFLFSYLEGGISHQASVAAAEGWGGDSYLLLEDTDGKTALSISIVWDSELDAREFHETFLTFTENRTGGHWADSNDNQSKLMFLPNQIITVYIENRRTMILFAPDVQTMDQLISSMQEINP